ncbi:MAG: extracellular solute-binding protein [Clostridiales bacterium]|nr:extracellular solute-binding protein [Clostridiales bacterium]
MKRSQFVRRLAAAGLCLAVLTGSSACKKKEKGRRREVKKSDPYFETEVIELKIPVDASREVEGAFFESVKYQAGQVMIYYAVNYKVPEGVTDYNWDDYYVAGLAVYDVSGSLLSDEKNEVGQNTLVDASTIDQDGNRVYLTAELNQNTYSYDTYVVFKNASGEEIKKTRLETPWSYGDMYFSSVRILPDGKIILRYADMTSSGCYAFDEKGKYLFQISSLDREVYGEIFVENGKYYALTQPSGNADEFSFMINEIDMGTGEIKPGKEVAGLSFKSFMVAGDGAYSATPNGLSKLNTQTLELEEILNWNQTDVDHSLLKSIKCYPESADEIHAIARKENNMVDEKYYLVNLKRAEKNPHAGQKILYVGGIDIPDSFYAYMYQYNADPQNKLRIESVDYGYADYELKNEEKSSSDVFDKVYLDILAGEAPDILLNFAGYAQFSNEELLVDLNTYMNGKDPLDKTAYFENIFQAMETDGKLYHAPVTLSLSGFMVNTDLIDPDRNWNSDDFDQAAASLPEDVQLSEKIPYNNMLEYFMGPNMSQFMDYNKKKVCFSSEKMVKALEEAKKYGSAEVRTISLNLIMSIGVDPKYEKVYGLMLGDANMGFDTRDVERLYTGVTALHPVRLQSVSDYNFFKHLLGGKGKLVGYPTIDGDGVVAEAEISLSIVASSQYKDEAWEVIRSFYSEDAQRTLTSDSLTTAVGFPMMEKVLREEGGKTVEKLNRVYQVAQKEISEGKDLGTILFPAEENTMDEILEIIHGIRFCRANDTSVWSIISEEAGGYYADSRTAEDVLKNIDNRATQLVQER